MEKESKIYVAGHNGMVGSAIVRELKKQSYNNIITRSHKELNLCKQSDVEEFFENEKPEYVFFPHWSWIIPSEIYQNYKSYNYHHD